MTAPKSRFRIDELAIRRPTGHDQRSRLFLICSSVKLDAEGRVSWQALVSLCMVCDSDHSFRCVWSYV